MRNALASSICCAGWLLAGAAVAQPAAKAAAPTEVAPLTVQAPPSPATVRKQTRDFIQFFAAPGPALDQLARWHEAICISVAGLSPDQVARVSSRIREVAQGVGVHTLSPGCHTNVEVVFTDKPQAFMDKVAKTREEVLGYYHRHDRDRLKTVTRPVQAWYMTTTNSGAVAGNSALAFAAISGNTGVTIHFQGKAIVEDDPGQLPYRRGAAMTP